MDSTASDNLPRRCKATNKRGEPCQGWAGQGAEFCFAHDPARAAERKEARSRGGRARHGRRLADLGTGEPVRVDDLGDVCELLARELGALLTLEVSVSRARAVGYLASVLASVYKDTELETRIRALEARAS